MIRHIVCVYTGFSGRGRGRDVTCALKDEITPDVALAFVFPNERRSLLGSY